MAVKGKRLAAARRARDRGAARQGIRQTANADTALEWLCGDVGLAGAWRSRAGLIKIHAVTKRVGSPLGAVGLLKEV